MMTVRLKNSGLIILTGDNVYMRENVEKSMPPNIVLAYNPTGFLTAFECILHDDGETRRRTSSPLTIRMPSRP